MSGQEERRFGGSGTAPEQHNNGCASVIDPWEVWRNLVAIDPNPPGPLATPPYILAVPSVGMDDEKFFAEAERLYRERSNAAPVHMVFRPIPRTTPAHEIHFVLPDDGMDELAFADKAVRTRLSLESLCRSADDQMRWA